LCDPCRYTYSAAGTCAARSASYSGSVCASGIASVEPPESRIVGGSSAAAEKPAGKAIHAVAGFSTGSFGGESAAAELPPTILLSGGSTDAIPLAQTLPLYDALRAAHVPAALYVYPHGSHDWPARQGTLGIEHAAAFLRKHLR
jgi:acetyl esterase/lipase